MTLKGGEIFLRTASGGFTPWDIQACAAYNQVNAAICNNSVSPGSKFFEDAGGGGSVPNNPPSKLSKAQPADLKEAARYLRDKANVNW